MEPLAKDVERMKQVFYFLIHSHSVGFPCGPFLLQLCTVMYSSDDDDCDILVQLYYARPGKDHYSTLGTNRFRVDIRGLERKWDGMLLLVGNWDVFCFLDGDKAD